MGLVSYELDRKGLPDHLPRHGERQRDEVFGFRRRHRHGRGTEAGTGLGVKVCGTGDGAGLEASAPFTVGNAGVALAAFFTRLAKVRGSFMSRTVTGEHPKRLVGPT